MRRTRRVLLLALLAAAQGCAAVSMGAHRYVATGADLNGLVLARESSLLGAIGYESHAVFRQAGAVQEGWMAGAGMDVTVLSGSAGNPYLIGGVEAGIGTKDHPSTWGSWSLGIGTQVLQLGPAGLRVEGRYRRMSADGREGIEVGLRIGRGWGAGANPPTSTRAGGTTPRVALTAPVVTADAAGGGEAGTRRASVASAAVAAMGTPYQWGGTDANGFDCSGLIQFAYRQAGIDLPRRSADQARAGVPVARDAASLLPGDILTFATTGTGEISHVGLYLGEGRFIHSATGGVQISVLSGLDPYGRWWFQRWIGARRVVGGET